MAEGVMAVMKHMPGHGRATVDSHHALPPGNASREVLERTDFLPFRLLSDLPWGMTSHLLFEAVDPATPVTVSARAIADVIRGHIGFDGLLLTDDLSIQALGGSLGERAGMRSRRRLRYGAPLQRRDGGDDRHRRPHR